MCLLFVGGEKSSTTEAAAPAFEMQIFTEAPVTEPDERFFRLQVYKQFLFFLLFIDVFWSGPVYPFCITKTS